MTHRPNENTGYMLGGAETHPDLLSRGDDVHLFARAERICALEAVRSMLDTLEPRMAMHGGISYYVARDLDGTEHRILVTNLRRYADINNVVVCINKFRDPREDEPTYPFGRVAELTDAIISTTGELSKVHTETLYRQYDEPRWQMPLVATLMVGRESAIQLFGNLASSEFLPAKPMRTLDIMQSTDALTRLYDELEVCSEETFRHTFTSVIP